MGVLVRMMQHRTDPRYDRRSWPALGGEFEVPEWEAEYLCRTDPHQAPPMAVRVPAAAAAAPVPAEPGEGQDDQEDDSGDQENGNGVLPAGPAVTGTGAPRRGRPPGSRRAATATQ